MDRPNSTEVVQFISVTLKACHLPRPCCWSDATAPAGYATLMMTILELDDYIDIMTIDIAFSHINTMYILSVLLFPNISTLFLEGCVPDWKAAMRRGMLWSRGSR